MRIEIAKNSGFCFGVRRALNLAEKTIENKIALPIHTLGDIVHNPLVVENLSRKGITPVEDISGLKPGILITRAHGTPPGVIEKAVEMGFQIVDATCPFVARIHRIVRQLGDEGYAVAVIGHAGHPEVEGITAHCAGKCLVMEEPEDVNPHTRFDRLGVVIQTTVRIQKARAVLSRLMENAGELRFFNTVCDATSCRQESAGELAGRADTMLVLGGRKSSNTRRLYEICIDINPSTFMFENIDEIDPRRFAGVDLLGITAGASTPSYFIDEVVRKLKT